MELVTDTAAAAADDGAAVDVTPPAPAELLMLPLIDLSPHRANIRSAVGDVSDLVGSVRSQGVVHPLVVVPDTACALTDRRPWTIIAGHRRHKAAQIAGLEEVPCIVRYDLADDPAGQVAAMLAENLERRDLTLVEEVHGVQQLLDLGVTIKDAATRTGMSQRRLRDRAKIAKARLDDVLTAQSVTLDDALVLASHPADRVFLERRLGTPNWTVSKEMLKPRAEARKWLTALTRSAPSAGVRVEQAEGPGVPWQTILREVLGVPAERLVTMIQTHTWTLLDSELTDAIDVYGADALTVCIDVDADDDPGLPVRASLVRVEPVPVPGPGAATSPAVDSAAADGGVTRPADDVEPADISTLSVDIVDGQVVVTGGDAARGEADEVEQAREAARESVTAAQLREVLAAAAAVRCRVVSTAVTNVAHRSLSPVARQLTLSVIADGIAATSAAGLVVTDSAGWAAALVTGDPEWSTDISAAVDVLADWLRDDSGAHGGADRAVLILAALNAATIDEDLRRGDLTPDRDMRDLVMAWLSLLLELGWEPCDAERAVIDAAGLGFVIDEPEPGDEGDDGVVEAAL